MTEQFVIGTEGSTSGAKCLALSLDGRVLGLGTATYEYIQGLPRGSCRLEQAVMMNGVRAAAKDLRRQTGLLPQDCLGIAAGGAMHGLNVLDDRGAPLDPIVCWDDAGDEEEAVDLTARLGVPIPRRFTFARWAGWKKRNPDKARRAHLVLTPSGYITYCGCSVPVVLPGDGSGMVGYMADPTGFDFHRIAEIDRQFAKLLPMVVGFGDKVGQMTQDGAMIFGWPVGTPWAGCCGDQPLGSYGKGCGRKGDISVELGQSIVVNVFGFKVILNKRGLVEALRSTLGEDMMMCCVTNGLQGYMGLFNFLRELWPGEPDRSFYDLLADKAAAAKPGAAGLMALPFFASEGSLLQGQSFAAILGLTKGNFTVGNVVRAFMETPILILRKALEEMGVMSEIRRVILSGGGAKDKIWGQIIADIFGAPVVVSACTEAVAFGAALNALCMVKRLRGENVKPQELADEYCEFGATFTPNLDHTRVYEPLVAQVLNAERTMRPLYALQEQGYFAG